MKNNKLSQTVIAKIKSWKGFEDFDNTNIEFLSKDPEIFSDCEITLLMKAIEEDDVKVVIALCEAGVDVNRVAKGTEQVPLTCFEEESKYSYEISKILINYGADVNYYRKIEDFIFEEMKLFSNPLTNACTIGNYNHIKYLIKSGADINFSIKPNSTTALCSVNSESKDYFKILELFILKGANLNVDGGQPLIIAVESSNLDAVKLLVNAGAKPNISSKSKIGNGKTAIMTLLNGACEDLTEKKEQELFEVFLKNIGNINEQDSEGRTILFYAFDTYIGDDDFDLFALDKVLFSKNIDINLTDNKGNTTLNTLLLSLEEEEYSTDELYDDERYKIESLLIAGSDIEARNNDGDSPKIIAKRIDNKEIQDLLENHKNLINTENRMGKTPLLLACLQGYTEKVVWLISKGAYVDTENKCHKIQRGIDLYGTFAPTYEDTIKPKFYTALMAAQNIEIVKVLIKAGADINKKNADGNTALMVYTKDNWFEGVERLITAGANTNLVNKWYETALIIARKNSKSKTMHYKEPEKLIHLLQERTISKFIPSVLSPLFCIFKNR